MLPKTSIEGVVVRQLQWHGDDRGRLSELFRVDELEPEFRPVMSYISTTKPGITRGPHEHEEQADIFCFIGPSTFRIYLWDNRIDSKTHGAHDRFEAGEANPLLVLVPKGVVHAYKNVGDSDGVVVNCPNRLYAGEGRQAPVDEIRHEDDPQSPFQVD